MGIIIIIIVAQPGMEHNNAELLNFNILLYLIVWTIMSRIQLTL